ncbi:MAG: T9SS type A sorting domain-containing protein, partial [Bacteroidia bacterium]|nr:T9SS type A sorting domain-containing protein [Bacteroidia bacterium]
DNEGKIWVGCPVSNAFQTYGGVSVYDGTNWVRYTKEDGLPDDYVRSIFQSKDGDIWVGTSSGVARFDGTTWTAITEMEIPDNRIMTIVQDDDEVVWCGSLSGGIAMWDGAIWTSMTTADGLVSDKIADLMKDRDGNVWMAYFDKGVTQSGPGALNLETNETREMAVFPNPVLTEFYITFDSHIDRVQLYTSHGRLIESWTTSKTDLPLELPETAIPGSYVLEIISNGASVRKKVFVGY